MTFPKREEASPEETEWVEIGVVARPHGLRGELKVIGVDEEMARFGHVKWVQLQGGTETRPRQVERFRANGRVVLLKVSGVDSREEAETLRGAEVLIPRTDVPEPEAGAYYAFELVGCEVFSAGGEKIGVVDEVQEFPANDVLVVQREEGEVLVPFVEPIIAEVNTEARCILLRDVEGLLE